MKADQGNNPGDEGRTKIDSSKQKQWGSFRCVRTIPYKSVQTRTIPRNSIQSYNSVQSVMDMGNEGPVMRLGNESQERNGNEGLREKALT
ncbi:hypothetical protein L484_004120 [Morus notabilis]|uniref:Uncharacterized protein n=1 Tax=Morus notabilis TaxID=981085 RepID=W9S7K1_9ROSA|nr:hypothetical protein L484_004120 [Morus notabilis]